MKKIAILIVLCCVVMEMGAQESELPDAIPHSIPSSPAFSLLGVNPELVTRPSDVKEFKVDWRIKNYKVAPDLALEAQPLWWLYYSKKRPGELRNMNRIQRILSTTSISFATAKVDNVNHLAWAIKANVYKEFDLFQSQQHLVKSQKRVDEQLEPYKFLIDSIQFDMHRFRNKDSLKMRRQMIRDLRLEMKLVQKQEMENLKEEAENLIKENWNMDMVDFSIGRVYTYDNAGIDSLRLRKAGWGFWLNGAKGIGKNGLVTGLFRVNRVGVNTDYWIGASYRFGNGRYNFFGELTYQRRNNNPINGFLKDDQFADLRSEDLGSGWYGFNDGDGYSMWTIAYGGDFRLNNNILLNFALRTNLDSDLKFSRFLPIANIICLMH